MAEVGQGLVTPSESTSTYRLAMNAVVGWLKGIGASIVGVVSGALLMYLSPLITSTIKPPEPRANFSAKADGFKITFSNRSTGATAGWWDFGDGSALEPFNPQDESISHLYARPGSYTVKLLLQNLVGEKNERSAPVVVEGNATASLPTIEDFKVIPLTPNNMCPAVFRVVGRVSNAEVTLVKYCDTKPIEICRDVPCTLDRIVTVDAPGTHTFRLVAIRGEKSVERKEDLDVSWPDDNLVLATVKVSHEAAQVTKSTEKRVVLVPWDENVGRAGTCAFVHAVTPERGGILTHAELVPREQTTMVQNEKITVDKNSNQAVLEGELLRPNGLFRGVPPPWQAMVKMDLEWRSPPVRQDLNPVTMPVALKGRTTIPLPKLPNNWTSVGTRRIHMTLTDGKQTVWNQPALPQGTTLKIQNRYVIVTAAAHEDDMVVTVTDPSSVVLPVSRKGK